MTQNPSPDARSNGKNTTEEIEILIRKPRPRLTIDAKLLVENKDKQTTTEMALIVWLSAAEKLDDYKQIELETIVNAFPNDNPVELLSYLRRLIDTGLVVEIGREKQQMLEELDDKIDQYIKEQ